jgi:hypothetical protein
MVGFGRTSSLVLRCANAEARCMNDETRTVDVSGIYQATRIIV